MPVVVEKERMVKGMMAFVFSVGRMDIFCFL